MATSRKNRLSAFLRRQSVFYLCFGIVGILLLIYAYYYIPNNQAEFNDRGTRVLRGLITNFLNKSDDLFVAFQEESLNKDSFRLKTDAYKKLYDNTRYRVNDTAYRDMFLPADWTAPFITRNKEWQIIYPVPLHQMNVEVDMDDFAREILEARSDIFSSYILLKRPDTASARTPTRTWEVIFRKKSMIISGEVRIDTLEKLQRNSDMSAVVELNISGTPTRVFIQPFAFHDEQLAIGGLIPKEQYQRYVRHTPVNFIAIVIIFILLVVITLPLIKVYFLSPHERITARTVTFNSLSIFMGASAILLVLIYVFIFMVSESAFHARMRDVGNKIRADIDTQIAHASAQLRAYDSLYEGLSVQEKRSLCYLETTDSVERVLDSKFTPKIFPELTRILWFDSKGNTLAKWNPFRFKPPLSNVSNYEFFKRVNDIAHLPDAANEIIVNAGKSNTTGEFQVYIAKPSQRDILTRITPDGASTHNVRANGIILATPLHCGTYPVLPPGFGFCVIDNSGEVLIHSDGRRNLSENILSETRDDGILANHLEYKYDNIIKNLSLYGKPHDMVVKPLKNQPLSVVVFFNKHNITDNIFRLLHFTVCCLLCIYLALALCIAVTTFSMQKPGKIKFQLNKIEWIRPSAGNAYSYRFTSLYFSLMLIVNVALSLLILLLKEDVRIILYLSFLVPLYTFWGFIIARRHLGKGHVEQMYDSQPGSSPEKKSFLKNTLVSLGNIFLFTKGIVVVVILFNFAFIYLAGLSGRNDHWTTGIIMLLAQLTYLAIMYERYKYVDRKIAGGKPIDHGCKEEPKDVTTSYLRSLYLGVLLISVFPTVGIIAYAFFSEKIQYKKARQLHTAAAFNQRTAYLKNEVFNAYKPAVFEQLKNLSDYFDLDKGSASIYLSDQDSICRRQKPSSSDTCTLYDEPYAAVINGLYQYIMPAFGELAIKNGSDDQNRSWRFTNYRDTPINKSLMVLTYKGDTTNKTPIVIGTTYHNPLYNLLMVFWPKGLLFLLLIALFIYIGWQNIDAIIKRLFLLNFFKSTESNPQYLEAFFNPARGLDPKFCPDLPQTITHSFFENEEKKAPTNKEDQEEYILRMTHCLAPIYEKIWLKQSEEERYLLYDLSQDGYTNYKNADTIYKLITKGILEYKNYQLRFFSLSFRNYVLGKRNTNETGDLIAKYSTGGVWQSIKTPVIMLVLATFTFFFFTQNDVAQDITAFVTALAAMVPLLIQWISRGGQSKDPS